MGKNIDIPDLPEFLRAKKVSGSKKEEPLLDVGKPFKFTCRIEKNGPIYEWDGKGKVGGSSLSAPVEYFPDTVIEYLRKGDWVKVDVVEPCQFTVSGGPGRVYVWDGDHTIFDRDRPEDKNTTEWNHENVATYFKSGQWKKV
jgi:hypothetical protein